MAAPERPISEWPAFSRALEMRRQAIGVSKTALAEAMGVTPERLRQWRNKPDARPSAEAVERGAAFLKCTPNDLWDGWDAGRFPRSTTSTRAPTPTERIAALEAEVAALRARIDAISPPAQSDLDAALGEVDRRRRAQPGAADSRPEARER